MLKKGKSQKIISENIKMEIEAGKKPSVAKAIAYSVAGLSKKKIGGMGSKYPDSYFDPKQLKLGIKIELEHTENKTIAKNIAKDHLLEIKDYYTHLLAMEKKYKVRK